MAKRRDGGKTEEKTQNQILKKYGSDYGFTNTDLGRLQEIFEPSDVPDTLTKVDIKVLLDLQKRNLLPPKEDMAKIKLVICILRGNSVTRVFRVYVNYLLAIRQKK